MVILGQSAPRVQRAADKAEVETIEALDIADATRKAFAIAEKEILSFKSSQCKLGYVCQF